MVKSKRFTISRWCILTYIKRKCQLTRWMPWSLSQLIWRGCKREQSITLFVSREITFWQVTSVCQRTWNQIFINAQECEAKVKILFYYFIIILSGGLDHQPQHTTVHTVISSAIRWFRFLFVSWIYTCLIKDSTFYNKVHYLKHVTDCEQVFDSGSSVTYRGPKGPVSLSWFENLQLCKLQNPWDSVLMLS